MEIVKTNTYQPLHLTEAQKSHISSPTRIMTALQQPDCIGFYAKESTETIGFALLRNYADGEYFLWNFIIDYKYQGQGKGKLFLQLLLNMLQQEYDAKMLTTTYTYGNDTAQKLYESFGFVQTDVVQEGDIHEVNMALALTFKEDA